MKYRRENGIRRNPIEVTMPSYPQWTNKKEPGRPKLHDEVDKAIGRRIRARRLELKIAQCWVAEAMGVSIVLYSNFERGRTAIKAGRLGALAQALQMSVNEMIGWHGLDSKEKSIGEELCALPGGLELAQAAVKMNWKQRHYLARLVKEIIGEPTSEPDSNEIHSGETAT